MKKCNHKIDYNIKTEEISCSLCGRQFEDLPKEKVFLDDYTSKEFCGILEISQRTLGREIVKGNINPRKDKSKCGTTEYRFSETDIKAYLWDNLPLQVKDRYFPSPKN